MDLIYRRIRHRRAGLIGNDPAKAGDFASLVDYHYCLVATYRKNGDAVPTPLWFAVEDATLYFRTAVDAFKARRIRANPAVRIGACNARGRPARSVEPLAGVARILEDDEILAAETLLQAKYGRRRAMYSRVFGGPWEYVAVSPAAPLPASIVRAAHQTALRIALAAIELEAVLGRIQAAWPSTQVAAAVDEELAEVRVYAQAPRLLAPTGKCSVQREKLIDQLKRSFALMQRIRRCKEWYDAEIVRSDEGQRGLALGEMIYYASPSLPFWMRDLEVQASEPVLLGESPDDTNHVTPHAQ